MPKGNPIPQRVKEQMYNSYTLGEKTRDIADRLGLNVVTVQRIIREQRKQYEKEREEMSKSGKIVKKDGKGGKLMALSPEGFEFVHVTPDGKSHKKKVSGHISRVAEQQYDKWCQELDDECEFIARVERRATEDKPEVVCGAPDDPIEEIHAIEPAPTPVIEVKPWKQVAEERQAEIDVLNGQVGDLYAELAELQLALEKAQANEAPSKFAANVISDTELDEPKLRSWFNDNGSFRVMWMDKPVYVIWAKGEQPRMYGVYGRMEDALKEIDRLNDVAAFLGNDSAFEVEEVAWR